MSGRAGRWHHAVAPLLALAVHAPSLSTRFYTHDCWNAVETGERVLSGTLGPWENLQRILVVWSFGLRASLGLDPLIWHLPNWLLHAGNAALVRALAQRLGGSAGAATVAGALFAVAPLLVHPVEWLGGGYDLVATLGVLGTALAAPRRPLLAALACAVALLGKETGVLAVPVALLVGRPLGLWERGLWRGLRGLALPTVLTVAALVGRWAQVRYGPGDGLAGRSLSFSVAEALHAGPVGAGVAALAPLADWVPLEALGWAGLAVAALAAWRLRLPGPLLAGGLALAPVLAIGIVHHELLANTRYLYLSAALLAPLIPLVAARALAAWPRVAPWLGVSAVLGSGWGGMDRAFEGARTTRAAAPVIDALVALPRGRSVTVLSGFYDEPTARFLMSQWLALRHGVRARYVMRGTGVMYVRRGGGRGDAALAYFGPAPRPFTPALLVEGERVLLQDVGPGSVEWVVLPTRPPASGPAVELDGPALSLIPGLEEPPVLASDEVETTQTVGPPAASSLEPSVLLALPPGAVDQLSLRLSARSQAAARYAAGYHDRWLGLFFGPPPYSTRRALSVELRGDGRPERVALTLWWDPVLAGAPTAQLAVLPCSYPAAVRFDGGAVRFVAPNGGPATFH